MSYSSGSIGGDKVTISDVQAALGGVSTSNLGALCKHDSINKWSKWKPIRFNGLSITESNLTTANYGFSTDLALMDNVNGNGTQVNFPLTKDPSDPYPWTYLPPRGGESEPYRLGDFRWYNSRATAPDAGYHDAIVPIKSLSDSGFHSSLYGNLTGSGGDQYPTSNNISRALLECFSCCWGNGYGNSWGNSQLIDPIPIEKIWSINNNIRVGLLLKAGEKWYPVCSLYTLGRIKNSNNTSITGDTGLAIPSFMTNTEAAYILREARTITAIPCLFKNIVLSFANGSDGKHFLSKINTCEAIYCMPSGQGAFTIKSDIYYSYPSAGTGTYEPNPELTFDIPSGYTFVRYIGVHKLCSKVVASGQYYSTTQYIILSKYPVSTDVTFTLTGNKISTNQRETISTKTVTSTSTLTFDDTVYNGIEFCTITHTANEIYNDYKINDASI